MKTISMTMTIMSLLVLMGVTFSLGLADQVSSNDRVTPRIFSGTIEGFDPVQQIVLIRTEEQGQGFVMFLGVTDAAVMKGLLKGDRVLVELEEHGMAKKIIKVAANLQDAPDPKN